MNEFPPDDIARVTDALIRGSQADAQFIEAWVGNETGRRRLVETLRGTRGMFPPAQAGEEITERVSMAVAQRIGKTETERISKTPAVTMPKKSSSHRMWRVAIAASAVAIAGVTLSKQFINPARTLENAVTTNRYVTGNGERMTVTLGDGTQVTLNVATELYVPDGFGVSTRTVRLKGEARFTVTHDPSLPFVVSANGNAIRDVATVFNVRAYDGTSATKVAVLDGAVNVQSALGTETTAAVVKEGQRATIALDGVTHVATVRDLDEDFAWVVGKLVLRDVALGEALPQLSRWYDREFRVSDSALLRRKVTASLPAELSWEYLETLAVILDARVEEQGRAVTFSPGR